MRVGAATMVRGAAPASAFEALVGGLVVRGGDHGEQATRHPPPSAGAQLIGAILVGWVAEKIGRLPTLLIAILVFVLDGRRLFAWSGASMLIFRFLQGIGTGGEVPVASACINEFISAKKRGDPLADADARVRALARRPGPHREGRQGRDDARAGSGRGRQGPARAGRPSLRREGHREVRLAQLFRGIYLKRTLMIALLGGLVTARFAIETKGKVLEELSP